MAIISPCRGTTEQWKAVNPILNDGEVGIERKADGICVTRIGNGKNHYFDLPILSDSGSYPKLNETAVRAEQAAAAANDAAGKATEVYDRLKDADVSALESDVTALNEGFKQHVENSDRQFAELSHQIKTLPGRKTSFRYLRDCLCGSTEADTCHWVSGEIWADGINIAKDIPVTANFNPAAGVLGDYTNGSNEREAMVSTVADRQWKYLQVDLGKIRYDIDTIKIYHYWNTAGRQYHHKLLVSDDAEHWYTFFDSDQQGCYRESEKGRTYYLNPTQVENRLEQKADQSQFADSGWIDLELLGGFRISDDTTTPYFRVRKKGDTVILHGTLQPPLDGSWNGSTFANIGVLPLDCIPIVTCDFLVPGYFEATDVVRVTTGGYIQVGKHMVKGEYTKPGKEVNLHLKGLTYKTE